MKIEGLKDKASENNKEGVMKNFLLISLEDNKAKKIAEVLNNDTSRKILDFLSKKEATESDISKELAIPMSTVHYNLKILQEANLVVVEEFHYSQKGKEINHYSLANKYIIITPKADQSNFMEALKKIIPIAIITAGVAGIMQLINYTSKATAGLSDASAQYGAKMMAVAPTTTVTSAEVSRPLLQSNAVAWFLIGGIAVIVIYFVYELVKKK